MTDVRTQFAALNKKAYKIAQKLGTEFGHDQISIVRQGPPSWVYLTCQYNPDDTSTKYIIRLTVDKKPEALFEKTRHEVALTRALNKRNASMQSFIGEPILKDGFVITISEYLPGLIDEYELFGGAIAKLHLAGEGIADTYNIASFSPLERTRKAYDLLANLYKDGRVFTVGNTSFPEKLLPVLHRKLEKGEAMVAEIKEIMNKEKYSYTILHHDVHIGNVRASERGEAVLIDLDRITKGPAEYDLARPLSQWVQRFGRPQAQVNDFMKGYMATRSTPLNKQILDLSMKISNLRYSISFICAAIESAERNDMKDDWNLLEGIKRFTNLEDPNFKWESREIYIARANDMG